MKILKTTCVGKMRRELVRDAPDETVDASERLGM